ncbi:MAG: hypothetical protein ABW133_13245, partial [Polyangiaceae bacterium]
MTEPQKKRTYWDINDRPSQATLAKRRLVTAVREFAALTATTDAPEETLNLAATAVEAEIERLRLHPSRTFRDAFATCKTEEDFAPFADRSLMTGLSNPYSPPMQLSMVGSKAVAR